MGLEGVAIREMIKNSTSKPCISAAFLKNKKIKLSEVKVSSVNPVTGQWWIRDHSLGSLCTPAFHIKTSRGCDWNAAASSCVTIFKSLFTIAHHSLRITRVDCQHLSYRTPIVQHCVDSDRCGSIIEVQSTDRRND